MKLRWEAIPAGWSKVEEEAPVRPRQEKLTLKLDDDLVR